MILFCLTFSILIFQFNQRSTDVNNMIFLNTHAVVRTVFCFIVQRKKILDSWIAGKFYTGNIFISYRKIKMSKSNSIPFHYLYQIIRSQMIFSNFVHKWRLNQTELNLISNCQFRFIQNIVIGTMNTFNIISKINKKNLITL